MEKIVNCTTLFLISFFLTYQLYAQERITTDFDWIPDNPTVVTSFSNTFNQCENPITVTLTITPDGFRKNNNTDYPVPAVEFGGNVNDDDDDDIQVTITFSQPVRSPILGIADLDRLGNGYRPNAGIEILDKFNVPPTSVSNPAIQYIRRSRSGSRETYEIRPTEANLSGDIIWQNEIVDQITFTYNRNRAGFSMFLSSLSFECLCPENIKEINENFDWIPSGTHTSRRITIDQCYPPVGVTLSVSAPGFRRNMNSSYPLSAAEFGGNLGAGLDDIFVSLSFSEPVSNPSLSFADLDYLESNDSRPDGIEVLRGFNIMPSTIVGSPFGFIFNRISNEITPLIQNVAGTIFWDQIETNALSFIYERNRQGFSMFLTEFNFLCSCENINNTFNSGGSSDEHQSKVSLKLSDFEFDWSKDKEELDVQIWPNPISDKLYLQHKLVPKESSYNYRIYNQLGVAVYTEDVDKSYIDGQEMEFDLSALPSGSYYIVVSEKGGLVYTKPFTKN